MTMDCEHCQEIEELVNALVKMFAGHRTVNILQAMACMYGYIEAEAPKPDIDHLMDMVRDAATEAFHQYRAVTLVEGSLRRPQ